MRSKTLDKLSGCILQRTSFLVVLNQKKGWRRSKIPMKLLSNFDFQVFAFSHQSLRAAKFFKIHKRWQYFPGWWQINTCWLGAGNIFIDWNCRWKISIRLISNDSLLWIKIYPGLTWNRERWKIPKACKLVERSSKASRMGCSWESHARLCCRCRCSCWKINLLTLSPEINV